MTTALYFEDLEVGSVLESEEKVVTAEEIINYAKMFDPQPFHVDETTAKNSHFKGLVASGWHTGCLAIRLLVDSGWGNVVNFGSPGFNDLKWKLPVRPGNRIHVRSTLTSKRPSTSKPDRGSYFIRVEVLNQDDEVVMSFESIGIARVRGPRQ